VAAFNLGLVMRQLLGRGTPRGLQGCSLSHFLTWFRILSHLWPNDFASERFGEGLELHLAFPDFPSCCLPTIGENAVSTQAARIASEVRD